MYIKRYMRAALLCLALGLTACYDDDSTMATPESTVTPITIAHLDDQQAVSNYTTLHIDPEVSGFSEDEMTYGWYVYGGDLEDKNGFRTNRIGQTKKLDYTVKLKSGSYHIVFEATCKEGGYSARKEFALTVTTLYSEGLYLLKETAEGNTDVDIYNLNDESMGADAVAHTQGEALPGKPQNLTVVYGKNYTDPETADPGSCIATCLTYGDGEMACYRTEDFVQIFDKSSILFEEEAQEQAYSLVTCWLYNFYFTNTGVRTEQKGGSSYKSGQFGYPMGSGGSAFVQQCNGQGMAYWDQQNHTLMYAKSSSVTKFDYSGDDIDWNQVEPIATGWNCLGNNNTLWFLFEDTSGQRYLVFYDSSIKITEVRTLDANLHLSRGSLIAGNAQTSASIYVLDDHRLYRYSLLDGTESAFTPEGLPAGGDITYLTNHFYYDYNEADSKFDYLMIGMQNGNEYTLAMYNLIGGLPYGAPVHIATGTGILKKACYVASTVPNMANYWAVKPSTSHPEWNYPTYPY